MALPDNVWVEWSPTTGPMATPVWVTLDYPLRLVSYRRGVKRAAQRVEAGEATIVVDNKSRAFDPFYRASPLWGLIQPRKPIRIRVRHRGRVWTLWTGYITGVRPRWSLNAATATISAVDKIGLYAGIPSPSVFWDSIAKSRPIMWYPLDEDGGNTAYDRIGVRHGTHTDVDLNGPPLLPYGQEGEASAVYPTLAAKTDLGTLSLPMPVTVTAVIQIKEEAGTPRRKILFGGGGSGSNSLNFEVAKVTAGDPQRVYLGMPNGTGGISTLSQVISTGPVHLVQAYATASEIGLAVDGVRTSSALTVGAPSLGSTWIGNGNNNGTLNSPFEKGSLSHVTVWDRALTLTERDGIWSAFSAARAGDTAAARIGWIMDVAGEGTERDLLEAGRELLGSCHAAASILDAANRAAATEGGLFLIDPDGRPTHFARNHQGGVGPVFDTNPTGSALGLQDLDIDMDERTFFTVGEAKVATPQPVTVTVRHANATTFGDLPWRPDTEYRSPAEAEDGARRAVGDATPVPHLTNADHYATEDTMVEALTLDVWDTCTVVGHPPDAGKGPFIAWDSGPFWDATKGWAATTPVRQLSRILETDTTLDFVERTTHRKMYLEPGRPSVSGLTEQEQGFETNTGVGGWQSMAGSLGTTTVNPIGGTRSATLTANATGTVDAIRSAYTLGHRGVWAEAYIRPGSTLRSARLELRYFDINGTIIRTDLGLLVAEQSTTEAVRLTVHGLTPATARMAQLTIAVLGAVAGEQHVFDDVRWWLAEDAVG